MLCAVPPQTTISSIGSSSFGRTGAFLATHQTDQLRSQSLHSVVQKLAITPKISQNVVIINVSNHVSPKLLVDHRSISQFYS